MGRLYFLFFVIGVWGTAHSQGKDQQIVDHTYFFLTNLEWPQEKTSYKVRVITQDRSLASAYKELAATKNVAGKPIEVGVSSYISIPAEVDVIFISSLFNGVLQTVIERIADKPILIITEESLDQGYVMVNLLSGADGNISFEFNRANILNQGIKIKPNFTSNGGTEINVAQLYRQVQDSVRSLEQKSEGVKNTIDSLNIQMAVARRILRENLQNLDSLEIEISEKEAELDRQSATLVALTQELDESEEQLVILADEIEKQERSLADGAERLQRQERQIKMRNGEIEQKEEQLKEMGIVVDTQQNTLILLIVFLVFLVSVLVVAYRAYQARNRAAKILNQQKYELKQLLDELQSAQSQLVQSEKMASLGTLTAGIAHEINNAINYVYSGIHVLNSKFLDIKLFMSGVKNLKPDNSNLKSEVSDIVKKKEEIEYDSSEEVIDTMIKSIQVGAERTIDIVKGLRTFSKAQEESMSEINIHEDIDVALLFLKDKIKHNIKIEQDRAENLPKMYGYPGQVGQAILSIIANALEAISSKTNPSIRIKTAVNGKKVILTIRDNGVGIKKEDQDKIFDPFYTTKKIGEGTGLGLSITYGIIEKHNGTIQVKSELGKGSIFKIELPLNDQSVN